MKINLGAFMTVLVPGFCVVPVMSEHHRSGCCTRTFSVSGHPLLCDKVSLIITGCVITAFTAPLTRFMSLIKTHSWVFLTCIGKARSFEGFFFSAEVKKTTQKKRLGDNVEAYWHKTLWLTSESLCRFAGLVVEQ